MIKIFFGRSSLERLEHWHCRNVTQQAIDEISALGPVSKKLPAEDCRETAAWRTDGSEFRSVESTPLGYIAYSQQSELSLCSQPQCTPGTVIMPSVLWHCWLGVRKSIWPVKIEWWGVVVVICLEQGADWLHMVKLMPTASQTPSTLASFKSRLVLPLW